MALVREPSNGAELQTELDNAALGDEIILDANVEYTTTESFILPKKTTGSGYIIIRSRNSDALTPGKRVSPTDAVNMPRLVTTADAGTSYSTIKVADGAHHYHLIGLEITTNRNHTFQPTNVVNLRPPTSGVLAHIPNHLIIDRCYIHGKPDTATVGYYQRRGIQIDASDVVISNCHISQFKDQSDAQAINIIRSEGRVFVVNNYLEATGENMLVGGEATGLSGLLPRDITVRRNYMAKDLNYRDDTPVDWTEKNLFEIKYGERYTIDGNLFDTTWNDGQHWSISFKVTPNSGSASAADYMTNDISFTNNWVRHAPTGISVHGRGWENGWDPSMENVVIRNNLWTDIDISAWGGSNGSFYGVFVAIDGGARNVTIDHNTAFQPRYLTSMGLLTSRPNDKYYDFVFTNNITNYGTGYQSNPGGIDTTGDPVTQGDQTLNNDPPDYFPNHTFTNNAFVWHTPSSVTGYYTLHPNTWIVSGFGTAASDHIRFQGFIDGDGSDSNSGNNYRLRSDSMYKAGGARDASDGKDLGADIDALNTALGNEVDDPGNGAIVTGDWSDYGKEIVLYASDAFVTGPWSVVNDATAAGGKRLTETDNGLAKVSTPVANPTSFFELTFEAQANTPYHLWIRGRAASTSSDSVHVQFTNTLNSAGNAAYRIGSTTSIEWVLEDGSGTGISNWGWRDSKWGTTVQETPVVFATSGKQTIRCQRREDGVSIDQIILSPAMYLGGGFANPNPGTEKDDTTILIKQDGSAGIGDIVLYASEAPTRVGNWTVTADSGAAGGNKIRDPNGYAAKISTPLASPAHYFEMTFNAHAGVGYRLWMRLRAEPEHYGNDSVWVQFDKSDDAGGNNVYRINSANGTWVSLEEYGAQGTQMWGWQDNGYGTSSPTWGPLIYFETTGTQTIRVQRREDGVSIDQILLSPETYLNAAPGPQKNDTTILPETQ